MLFDWLMLNFPIFLGHSQETIMSLSSKFDAPGWVNSAGNLRQMW